VLSASGGGNAQAEPVCVIYKGEAYSGCILDIANHRYKCKEGNVDTKEGIREVSNRLCQAIINPGPPLGAPARGGETGSRPKQ
jgi:hypothetical protein